MTKNRSNVSSSTQDAILLLYKKGVLNHIVEDSVMLSVNVVLDTLKKTLPVTVKNSVKMVIKDLVNSSAQLELIAINKQDLKEARRELIKETARPENNWIDIKTARGLSAFVPYSTVMAAIHSGKIRSQKKGKKYLVYRPSFLDWVSGNQ